MAHRVAVVVRRKARVAAMTVIVQAVTIGVMIVRQAVVVAQQANLPAIAVKRGRSVAHTFELNDLKREVRDRSAAHAACVPAQVAR